MDLAKQREVLKEDGEKFASKIRAPYIETSALSGVGHDEIFKIAVLEARKRKSKFRLDIFSSQSNTSAGC